MTMSDASKPRRPGRPPQSDEEQARARANIVRATALVFAEYGYHGISVARILEHAGIARPTFYRYFRNSDEPLRLALDEIGRELRDRVVNDVMAAEGDIPKVTAAIDAYLWWSGEHRAMLRSLYAGIHDPASPVAIRRPSTLQAMIDLLFQEFEAAGRPEPRRWMLDVYVNAVEFTCYQLYLETEATPRDVAQARAIMLRMAIATLGSHLDWEGFLEGSHVFDMPEPDPAAGEPPADSERATPVRRVGPMVGDGPAPGGTTG
jgi:TetR/AcrR family transcriptional regulator